MVKQPRWLKDSLRFAKSPFNKHVTCHMSWKNPLMYELRTEVASVKLFTNISLTPNSERLIILCES